MLPDQLVKREELNAASRRGLAEMHDGTGFGSPTREAEPLPILSFNAPSSRSSIPTWVTMRVKRGWTGPITVIELSFVMGVERLVRTNDAAVAWNIRAAGVFDAERERPVPNACSRPIFAL